MWSVVNLVLIKSYHFSLHLNPLVAVSLTTIMTVNVFLFLVRQEQELRNGGTVDKKLSTLADLFRPPIELMHKGSFETVRSHSPDTIHRTSLFSLLELLVKFQMVAVSEPGNQVPHRWVDGSIFVRMLFKDSVFDSLALATYSTVSVSI